jgi:membrane dipeptidase
MNALQLHKDALIWDAHRDVAYEAPLEERFLQGWTMGVDLHLPLLQAGGMDVQVFAICVAGQADLPPSVQAFKEIEKVLAVLDARSDEIVLATSIAQVLQARAEGKIAAILGMEGAEPILTELDLLRLFYRLGQRHLGLTWNYRNALADGGYEGRKGGGLSNFGRAVVKELNRLGMVVDVAHMTPNGMREVLALSEQPIIHSHGGTRGINPSHPRTVDDDVLEAMAANGGVFCVTSVPGAMTADPATATLDDMLDHVDHAVRVMGADHVGLGADFDVYQSHLGLPPERWLADLEEVDKWPNVTAGLLARGYQEADVRKIMGENLQRVFSQVIG